MKVRVALAQIPNTADIVQNKESILKHLQMVEKHQPDLVLFPECALSGFSTAVLDMCFQSCKSAVEEIKEWTRHGSATVVLPTAWPENFGVLNAGFILRNGRILGEFFKEGLTESERQLFMVPKRENGRMFSVRGVRFAMLICAEAQKRAWEYFDQGSADVILWPGYWRWKKEDCWSSKSRNKENDLVHMNVRLWRVPLLQANFCFNDKSDQRKLSPEGRSVIIDGANCHRHSAPALKSSGSIVELVQEGDGARVLKCFDYIVH